MRSGLSEHLIMKIHDRVYAPLKRRLATHALTLDEWGDPDPATLKRRKHLDTLRSLLDKGARERKLQDALMKSGLLSLGCKAISEVTMKRTEDHRGMRMDLVLGSMQDEPTQIIELKRGTHLLLARAGTPTEKLSREIEKAVKQLKGYGNRLQTDAETVVDLEEKKGIRFNETELRLVAGRRPTTDSGYHLLSSAEGGSDLQLQIYTWDGFLAELERIVD